MEYFIESCLRNKDFNWLFYGNLKITIPLPNNIQLKKADIADFTHLASTKLGYTVALADPYKICDFRPAFGQIFEDFLKGFEFWGYSDMDIIYGNFSHFISVQQLDTYDIITSRREYAAGHFTLYRNNPLGNSLYKNIFNIKSLLQEANFHFALDERSNLIGKQLKNESGINSWHNKLWERIKRHLLFRLYRTRLIAFDITQEFQRKEKKKILNILWLDAVRSDQFYTKQNRVNWSIEWNDGMVTDKISGTELMYFHFLNSKQNPHFIVSQKILQRSFIIDRSGIHCTS
jgi:hypothetical protein